MGVIPLIGVPVAVLLGVAAVEERLPQVALAPVLILAPLLAGLLVSVRAIAVVSVLAVLLMVPLGFADHISGTGTQFGIITGILAAGSIAVWISRIRGGNSAIESARTTDLAHTSRDSEPTARHA